MPHLPTHSEKRKGLFWVLIAAAIKDWEAAFPWVVEFGARWKQSDPAVSNLINKAIDFWGSQMGE